MNSQTNEKYENFDPLLIRECPYKNYNDWLISNPILRKKKKNCPMKCPFRNYNDWLEFNPLLLRK
jgi:hypothetical protein